MVSCSTNNDNGKSEKVKIALSCDDEQSEGWDLRDPPEAKGGL